MMKDDHRTSLQTAFVSPARTIIWNPFILNYESLQRYILQLDISCTNQGFRDSPQFLQANAGMVIS
jgi:hypothetical protein